jgi:hypothetical protein
MLRRYVTPVSLSQQLNRIDQPRSPGWHIHSSGVDGQQYRCDARVGQRIGRADGEQDAAQKLADRKRCRQTDDQAEQYRAHFFCEHQACKDVTTRAERRTDCQFTFSCAPYQWIRMLEWKVTKQDGVDKREHGRRRSDANGERQDHRREKPGWRRKRRRPAPMSWTSAVIIVLNVTYVTFILK